MPVSEQNVAEVVKEVSESMKEPMFSQLAIGDFVSQQPQVSRYFSSKLSALGGGEGVMHAAFHASVVQRIFDSRRAIDAKPRLVTFDDLDQAGRSASGEVSESMTQLQAVEPALASYLHSNVEQAAIRQAIALFALAYGG